ncbi:MAG: type II toxin-antitoxin system RelE/ParE family toxin [Leptospiraceae bacterium]|nr:type II toxin-antitoxin system RelE/ParE family toxin [Leptospiraceae bacterium]
MILSFKDRDTERVFLGEYSKKLPRELHKKALTKLLAIHASNEIEELKIPPSNRLHKLEGDRKNQWSISINDKYRVCFYFRDGNANEVEITDYH